MHIKVRGFEAHFLRALGVYGFEFRAFVARAYTLSPKAQKNYTSDSHGVEEF